MWVFNQSSFYFSVYLGKQRPAPICLHVNYRTIKTCLNQPSQLREHLYISTGQRSGKFCENNDKRSRLSTQRPENLFKNKIILKLFPLLQHDAVFQLHLICASDLFMQSIPIQALLLYSNRETEISPFLFDITKRMQCNLGVSTMAALLPKHQVLMKRAGVLCVQQTLFSGQSLTRAYYIFSIIFQ